MAPKKAKADNKSAGPKFVKSELVSVHDISISRESGWRPLDPARVGELVADFKAGSYGQNTLAAPSLIDACTCLSDGKRRLDNGVQCVAALQILSREIEESKANGEDLPDFCLRHSLSCSG